MIHNFRSFTESKNNYDSKQLDEILDKINKNGYDNLSDYEKKYLDFASGSAVVEPVSEINCSDYIFSVIIDPFYERGYAIMINPVEHWEEEGTQYDNYIKDEIKGLPSYLEEQTECLFRATKRVNIERCIKDLVEAGFKYDIVHQDFLKHEEDYNYYIFPGGLRIDEYMENYHPTAVIY